MDTYFIIERQEERQELPRVGLEWLPPGPASRKSILAVP